MSPRGISSYHTRHCISGIYLRWYVMMSYVPANNKLYTGIHSERYITMMR
jgi:hypothetical protein